MIFKILHISDIHISSKEDKNHKMLRENLVKYVKEKVKNLDAVVITGDIVDRCDLDAFPIGKGFIEELLKVANISKSNLVIVPGNHDMKRNSAIDRLLDESAMKEENFLSQSGEFIKIRMDGYAQFIEDLEIDYGSDNQYGYGIRVIEKGGEKICFNLLNSAWSNKGKDDYKHLFIGRQQLEYNRNKIEAKSVDYVISVMHHPLSWLAEEEEELLKDYLLHEQKIGSSLVLHGHIHNATIQAEENPMGKIVSLISGIGYPKGSERESGQPKISSCRFSVYDLDMNQKKADCLVLISTENGAFVPDNTLYKGSENGHYSICWGKDQQSPMSVREKYIDLDPIPVTKCWSGREEELEMFSRGYASVISISGVGGQGKTALAAEFMRRDAEDKRQFEQRVWVDCRELEDTMHTKLLRILERLTDGKESESLYKEEQLRDTIKRFQRYVNQHKVMIVFDNIDAYVVFDTGELVGELSEVIDGLLTQPTSSLIILTCRTAIYNSSANFRTIPLDGLRESEGIEYFKKRGINLADQEDLEACKKMIQVTKGHPWWIGLICGQIIADRARTKDYWEQNRDRLLTHNSQLEQYFSAIWNKMGGSNKGAVRQRVIRFLAESARPLTVSELSDLLNENYNQTSKAVNHLYHIGLVIEHNSAGKNTKSYQIHPLVREYIHKLYDSDVQRPFVHQLLELLMGRKLFAIIFRSEKNHKDIKYDTQAIIDSIETCLNSRNETDALNLITYSFGTLCDEGRFAEYLELSGRILDKINWTNEQMTLIKNRSDFLYHFLDILAMQEYRADKARYYLDQYEKNCEKNTIAYSGYLVTKANVMWLLKDYSEAYSAIKEYNDMKDKYRDLRCPTNTDNLEGVILREYGKIDEALDLFEAGSESAARLGNIARCYQKQGEFDKALDWLKGCLNEMRKEEGYNGFNDYVNEGYAYFWIAEIYYQQGKIEEAHVFMTLCQEIWKEYSPGLLPQTEGLLASLGNKSIEMKPNQREDAINNFII